MMNVVLALLSVIAIAFFLARLVAFWRQSLTEAHEIDRQNADRKG